MGVKRKVKCIETGKVFNSFKEAGDFYNINPNKIGLVCNGKQKTAGGFTWETLKNEVENLPNEIWRPIRGFESFYEVSNLGRVKSLCREAIDKTGRKFFIGEELLKGSLDNGGYLHVKLTVNGSSSYIRIHREVAIAFIPNPENKPTVDHINTIRTDNRVENLRWATHKEQLNENHITHSRMVKVCDQNKDKALDAVRKCVRCITTNREFDSVREASKFYNCDESGITKCCKKKAKSAGKLNGKKLVWEYIDE